MLFFSHNEKIKHLFFDCQHARFVWRIVHIATRINSPRSKTHLFGNWWRDIESRDRNDIFVGVTVMLWLIWCTRNDIVFEKKYLSFLHVIFRGVYWLQFWALLQREDVRETFRLASKVFEVIALDIFAESKSNSNNRLCL